MEYCAGGEILDKLMENGAIKESTVKKYMWKLFHAINHCHAMGICHRDLKPENFLLSTKDDDEIKIIDFGLSQKFSNIPMNEMVGSPHYVSPGVLNKK